MADKDLVSPFLPDESRIVAGCPRYVMFQSASVYSSAGGYPSVCMMHTCQPGNFILQDDLIIFAGLVTKLQDNHHVAIHHINIVYSLKNE